MKAIVCEMCNSNDVIKQDGVFVCQSCGTKYSVEEAKKMMIEGPVTVVGKVSIDNSASYDRIIGLARDAFKDKRFDSAYDYYCQAIDIRPNETESILRQGLSILAKDEIQSSVPSSCKNRVAKAVEIIKQMEAGEEKDNAILSAAQDLKSACDSSRKVLQEIIDDLNLQKMKERSAGDILGDLGRPAFVASQNQAEDKRIQRHNQAINAKIDAVKARSATIDTFEKETIDKLLDGTSIDVQFTHFYRCGTVDKIIELYPNISLSEDRQKKLTEENNYLCFAAKNHNVEFTEILIEMGADVNFKAVDVSPLYFVTAYRQKDLAQLEKCCKIARMLVDAGANIDMTEQANNRTLVNTDTPEAIKQILAEKNPDVLTNISKAPKSGCYVATAVYGSYDCPQVWTLRRYRDDTLAATRRGRAFIRTYYAISPTLVKWFGESAWFKNMWQPRLDKLVERLNTEGVQDTPYEDREW